METKPLPSTFIDEGIVNARTGLYRSDKHKILSAYQSVKHGKECEETKYVWYSKGQIQDWLNELNDLKGDGIRLYFGQVEPHDPENPTSADPEEPLPGQLCLLVVLTKPGSYDASHVNIFYRDTPGFDARLQLTNELKLADRARQFNYGGYSPPMRITEGDDFPNDFVS
jgi:hypothetical protein